MLPGSSLGLQVALSGTQLELASFVQSLSQVPQVAGAEKSVPLSTTPSESLSRPSQISLPPLVAMQPPPPPPSTAPLLLDASPVASELEATALLEAPPPAPLLDALLV